MYKFFFKRVCDLVVSIIALPFWLIVLLIIGPIIYFQDRGSIFYNAPRLGKDGRIFKMYKFRSMKINAPDIRNEDGSTFNSEDDPRLTHIGKLMRKASIDELPQLLNVLIGDMSIIGPRPDLPEDLKLYNDFQKKRLEVKPGITGYSQAYFRNSATQEEKFNNDSFYAENITLLFDLKIVLKTIVTVLRKENVYKNKGEYGNKTTIKQ
ncbi:sugar transferase [Clostridium fungisolvens]|uniref:Undecaprenyl phosphate N,N'-diacetylbacillosamine 1-phosphate transferase n=1 Tax=Clostridium fungisolvens TaxID=1604897 RepID=A0A6V8SAD2_9CLOT|nr:sugar transferase [Clostridium fungisolvens]GFP74214.1 Undecaprenyl phosphate N,N'-diacetylbacillosamine 1-phosphate transferase [Clostridium fungisolvens]